jgi:hypothetical protein
MVIVIRHKTKATACWTLPFIVRIFVNDTITVAVWTSFDTITIEVWISFHLCVPPSAASPHRQPWRLREGCAATPWKPSKPVMHDIGKTFQALASQPLASQLATTSHWRTTMIVSNLSELVPRTSLS